MSDEKFTEDYRPTGLTSDVWAKAIEDAMGLDTITLRKGNKLYDRFGKPITKEIDMSVEKILEEREKTHGKYSDHAGITQTMKLIMRGSHGWQHLDACQCETLEMIVHKIGRILAGNPNVQDHWDDIAGYSTLVSKELQKGDAA